MNQVLGYTTGRYPACFLLEYVKTGAAATHLQTLREELDARLPARQNAASPITITIPEMSSECFMLA